MHGLQLQICSSAIADSFGFVLALHSYFSEEYFDLIIWLNCCLSHLFDSFNLFCLIIFDKPLIVSLKSFQGAQSRMKVLTRRLPALKTYWKLFPLAINPALMHTSYGNYIIALSKFYIPRLTTLIFL